MTQCDFCLKDLKEGETATALTDGEITIEGFNMDLNTPWFVLCEECAEKVFEFLNRIAK